MQHNNKSQNPEIKMNYCHHTDYYTYHRFEINISVSSHCVQLILSFSCGELDVNSSSFSVWMAGTDDDTLRIEDANIIYLILFTFAEPRVGNRAFTRVENQDMSSVGNLVMVSAGTWDSAGLDKINSMENCHYDYRTN